MAAWCGEGQATPPTMDSAFSPCTDYDIIIRQLLFLVHDEYLWLGEPIPIMAELIHMISWLPCKGKGPVEIARKSRDLMPIEAMKKKYKLEKNMRGYVTSSIKDKGVCIATQLLAGKVMKKCLHNEVPATSSH